MRDLIVMTRIGRGAQVALVLVVGLVTIGRGSATSQQIDIPDTQIQYNRGQNVAPIFEGWIKNPDGTVDMWFGYLNQNYQEVLHVPIGPDNNIQPGGPDLGQPTVFIPRRRRGGAMSRRESYVFSVRVPDDFDEDDELVWTVAAHGKTDRAVGTLLDLYALDPPEGGNQPPTVRVEASASTVGVGDSITLTATINDDDLPEGDRSRASVKWENYHGPGNVRFTPVRSAVPEGTERIRDLELSTTASFSEPGTYVIRAVANDGEQNPAGFPKVPSTGFTTATIQVRP